MTHDKQLFLVSHNKFSRRAEAEYNATGTWLHCLNDIQSTFIDTLADKINSIPRETQALFVDPAYHANIGKYLTITVYACVLQKLL